MLRLVSATCTSVSFLTNLERNTFGPKIDDEPTTIVIILIGSRQLKPGALCSQEPIDCITLHNPHCTQESAGIITIAFLVCMRENIASVPFDASKMANSQQ